MSTSNPCAKMVTVETAYEVYQSPDGDTTHWVLKKYKNPENEANDPFARWYVATKAPGTLGSYEYGDTYAANIKVGFVKIDNPLCHYVCVRLDNETTFSMTQLLKYRYEQLRVRDAMLVNYMRLAVPKQKLELFKNLAQEHQLTLVCIDAEDEVGKCRADLHTTQQKAES